MRNLILSLTFALSLASPSVAFGGIGWDTICSANPPTYWHRVERVTGVPWARFVVRWQPALCDGDFGPLFQAATMPAWERPVVGDLTDPGACSPGDAACVAGGTDDLGATCAVGDSTCVVVDSATVGAP